MKQLSLKSSGTWKKKPKKNDEDGLSRSGTGCLQVRAKTYMKHLHENPAPLQIAPRPGEGPLELHHTKNPLGGLRRACDAAVIPLHRSDHELLEMNPNEERLLQRAISCWATFSYWCWSKGLAGTSQDALAFNAWVLTHMEAEQ